jgi:hypothetical protein
MGGKQVRKYMHSVKLLADGQHYCARILKIPSLNHVNTARGTGKGAVRLKWALILGAQCLFIGCDALHRVTVEVWAESGYSFVIGKGCGSI